MQRQTALNSVSIKCLLIFFNDKCIFIRHALQLINESLHQSFNHLFDIYELAHQSHST